MTTAVVRLATAGDAASIAAIYNQGISERKATFETTPRTAADMAGRIEENPDRYPFLVAEEAARVVGWAAISSYRPRDCYRGVGEFSVYVDAGHRGRKIGALLLDALIAAAAGRGYWKLLSRIFTANAQSLALCRSRGFREVGVYERHGQLDGQWLDVVIVERLIPENQA